MILQGTIHLLGDNVDTDVMLPGRYLSLAEPAEIARHLFEEVDPGFVERVKPGDLLIAGANFGAGSGREHVPVGLKALGIGCIVAASFARTFYRMAVDLGLPLLLCPEAVREARQGQRGRVDTTSGTVEVGGRSYQAQPLPPFLQEIVDQGGLVPWVRKRRAGVGESQEPS